MLPSKPNVRRSNRLRWRARSVSPRFRRFLLSRRPVPPLQPVKGKRLAPLRSIRAQPPLATSANNRKIAQALYIAEKTVKNHITNILSCLGLRDRTQAALLVSRLLPMPVGDPGAISPN
ncbi:MAG: response regulator transcription factor [Spirulinaceae cyanobacterium SM2_1_0]|nr:response regulator transcription factor [Spirulinaceae cyanobacterium SM2_1_0]